MADPFRRTLASQLRSSRAHAGLERAVAEMPAADMGRRLENHPHTAWRLLDHLRLTAEDLVDYCRDPDYEERSWPEGYWPIQHAPPGSEAWEESVGKLREAVEAMASMVEDEERDLYEPVPAAESEEHHLARCAMVLVDHNGYHLGQLISLRRGLGCWPPGEDGGE